MALGVSVTGPAGARGPGDPDPEPTQPVLVQSADGALDEVEVTDAELTELRRGPLPVITRGRTVEAQLAQSVPKVGAPPVWGAGQRGAGEVIVVIDTGVASDFGGTLVGQACFAADITGAVGFCGPEGDPDVSEAFDATCFDLGVCGGGDALDPTAARPCPGTAPRCAHGTAVAAVAARHEPTPGVAPDAGVYAIQVFNPAGTNAFLFDVFLALEHVVELADAGMNIAAVNLSVATTDTYPAHCDVGPGASDDALALGAVLALFRARGIGNAVASGNDAKTGSVALPACVSSAVAVGATDLDDDIADFGNRGPALDLVAPGADEGNGTIDGMDIPGNPVVQWAGTSFSAPHVAGAFALLGPEYPKASVNQLVSFLRGSAVGVRDAATGASYRRLQLRAPAQVLRAQVLFPTDLPVAGTLRSGIGDFDGDGHADVLAHGPGSAPDRISYGRDDWFVTTRSRAVSGSYLPLVGNFRGTDADDILWYAPGGARDYLWIGNPSRNLQSVSVTINGTYYPVIGDFDGDGFDDVFWYGPGAAPDFLWYGGAAGFTSRSMSVTGSVRVAVGDFNGDGRDDLILHGPGPASDAIWRGTSTRGVWAKRALTMSGSYTMRVGDFNGDGLHDLLLYQPGGRSDSIWRGGPAVGGGGATGGFAPLSISVNGTYAPVIGDVDGDAIDDIVWYAAGPAGDYIWFGRAVGVPSSRPISAVGTYYPLTGNLDDDDGDEIIWFSTTSTTTPVWWSHAP